MKAAEYARRITDAATDEAALSDAIMQTVRGLAEESADLFRQRGRNGAAGIAREIDAKWRAICARVPPGILNPNGWRDMLIARSDGELAPLFDRRPLR